MNQIDGRIKRPRDLNQLAKRMIDLATGNENQVFKHVPTLAFSPDGRSIARLTGIIDSQGQARGASISVVGADGSNLGVGVYYTPNSTTTPWKVYGAIFKPWQKPQLVSLDDSHPVSAAGSEPPGDYMGSYFLPNGILGVIWTRRELSLGTTLERSIYFARSLK